MSRQPAPDRWHEIDELFACALEFSASVRARLLEAWCGNDADLRREVLELLAAEAGANDFLGPVAAAVLAETLSAAIAVPAVSPQSLRATLTPGSETPRPGDVP